MKILTLRSALIVTVFGRLILGASEAPAALIHNYELDGSFGDTFGGPALVPNGGVLNATTYSFAPNQGLTLSNALPDNDNYTILLDFNFANLSLFRRILEFKNGTSDNGLYTLNTSLAFFPVGAGPSGAFAPNVNARMVLTRDGLNDLLVGYVNGVPQFSFTHISDSAAFTEPGGIMKFFIDNASDASAGVVDRISIFNTPLTASEVAALGPVGTSVVPVPEPSTAIGAVCLVGVALGARPRRRQSC